MASSRAKNPDGFRPEFVRLYLQIPHSQGKPIFVGTFRDPIDATDCQRLVRQYGASLRKFPLHRHAWIERQFRVEARLTREHELLHIHIVGELRKPDPVKEELHKWARTLGLQ